jgi:DNA modification methylase
MTITILQGDVVEQLRTLPDCSVQCVCTSPPYWGLRDYGVEGQIGLEKTPEGYTQKMVDVFREVRRVLRDDGTLWLNLGDSYASGKGTCYNPGGGEESLGQERKAEGCHPLDRGNKSTLSESGLKPKDLVGIPWRVAFALQSDGWYLRSDIIWSKPNPMPESVTDRPTKAHEYVFLLSKKAKYYYDADAVREPLQECSIERAKYGWNGTMVFDENGKETYRSQPDPVDKMGERWSPTSGRNRRTVWEIATQPTPEAHFATFPEALVEPCIKAGTSERGCCPVCGAGWERVVDKPIAPTEMFTKTRVKEDEKDLIFAHRKNGEKHGSGQKLQNWRDEHPPVTTGWQPTCSCSHDETIPCTVLDPFGGSGTTGLVARNLKRDCILIELNPAYVKIMKKKLRLNEQLVMS